MEKLIVDRIENGIAVLEREDKSLAEIPVSDFPFEICEGNVIVKENGSYSLSLSEEEERRKRISEKQQKFFKKM